MRVVSKTHRSLRGRLQIMAISIQKWLFLYVHTAPHARTAFLQLQPGFGAALMMCCCKEMDSEGMVRPC